MLNASKAVLLAEEIAVKKGYRIISDSIISGNLASRKMREKLGFELDREYKKLMEKGFVFTLLYKYDKLNKSETNN